MTHSLSMYLPMDRRQALAGGAALSEQRDGAALLADIVGFTPLTEQLASAVGPLRGAEEVAALLNRAYGALIDIVDALGGSVVCFSGDAITCWFDNQTQNVERKPQNDQTQSASREAHLRGDRAASPGEGAAELDRSTFYALRPTFRAAACALAMQRAMGAFAAIALPGGGSAALSLKVAVATGQARRMLVGDPSIQRYEVLAGSLIDRLAALQHHARSGEVLLDEPTARRIGPHGCLAWRETTGGQAIATISALAHAIVPQPWPALAAPLADETCQQWLLPAVAARLACTPTSFLAELRPAVALMLEFHGLDYDTDERASARLDSFIHWVQQAVARYQGAVIDLTMGDRGSYLYAAWGAPEAHDDDAARAVAAARELLAPPPEMSWLAQMRIGLARGTLWSGAYGGPTRRTYGVLGDATNLAFRLMSQAPPGAIWCDHTVMRAAEQHWSFAELPPVRVKGKAGLIRVYGPVAPDEQPDAPSVGPLVGRDAEQALLVAALDAVIGGESRLAVVEGEAGIGKSRLVHALSQQVCTRGLVVLSGAAQSIERNTPYRAWRDVVGSFFGLREATDRAEQRSLVQATVQALRPNLLACTPLLNDVLHLDIPETPQTRALDPARRSESLDNLLVELLQAWACEQPLIVVLEDAHWLDSRSWDVAVRLARALSAARQPLLLLITTRPLAANDQGSVALGSLLCLQGAMRIQLGALPAHAIAALTANRLAIGADGLADDLAALIQARSGGNPYFAEELVDTLQRRALIWLENDKEGSKPRYAISPVLAHDARLLPDTLQGLLLARIDRLPPEEQLTLKVAAVVGATFAYPPLRHARAHTASTDDVALMRQLGTLVERDFTARARREPDLAYHFKHILAQEVAYQTLLYAQRRVLHRTIAEWYERGEPASADDVAPEPLADRRSPLLPLLVHHYRQAEDVARERHYARLAGLQAADQYANSEALAYFSRALALTPPDDRVCHFDLMLERLNIHARCEELKAVARELDAMEPLADALGDDARRARCAVLRAIHAARTCDYPNAIAQAQRALALAQSSGEVGIVVDARRAWATALGRQGDLVGARAQNEILLHVAREQGDKVSEMRALNSVACNLIDLDDYAAAREHLQACLRLACLLDDSLYESIALRNLGMVALDMRDYATAQASCERSLVVARAVGVTTSERNIPRDLGQIAHEQGDFDAALAAFEESLRHIAVVGDPVLEAEVYGELARLFWKRGEYATAHAHAHRALDIAQSIDNRLLETEMLTTLGHTELALGHIAAAQRIYRKALAMRRAMGQSNRATEAEAGLARVALHTNDLRHALARVERILPHLATRSLDGASEPFLVELTCYQVLRAAADPRASAVLEASFAHLQQALATIPNPSRQQSFLEQVPVNSALMAAWSALQTSDYELSSNWHAILTQAL